MGQLLKETGRTASLRIVFDDGPMFVPLPSAMTFGDVARLVSKISMRRCSPVAAVDLLYAGKKAAALPLSIAGDAMAGDATPAPGLAGTAAATALADVDS